MLIQKQNRNIYRRGAERLFYILLFSGYVKISSLENFWSNEEDFGQSFIKINFDTQ